MDRFRALVAAQGGDLSRSRCRSVRTSETVTAPRAWHDGRHRRDGGGTGGVAARCGPARPGEPVQFGAGLRIHRRPGEPVAAGDAVFTLYTDTPERFEPAIAELDGGWTSATLRPRRSPLIIDRITWIDERA